MISLPQLAELLRQNKKIIIINAAVIAGMLILALYFFILPLRKEIGRLGPVKDSNEKVIAAQKTLMNNKKLRERVEKLNTAIPENPDILKIGSNIQTLAVKNGLLLKSLAFPQSKAEGNARSNIASAPSLEDFSAKPIETDGLAVPAQPIAPSVAMSTVSFTVDVVGSQDNFKKFLQNLEMNLRLIDVEDIKIPLNSKSSNNDYHLELNAYYLPLSSP